jgi:hypothetical protein
MVGVDSRAIRQVQIEREPPFGLKRCSDHDAEQQEPAGWVVTPECARYCFRLRGIVWMAQQQGDKSATQPAVGGTGQVQQKEIERCSRPRRLRAAAQEVVDAVADQTVDEVLMLADIRICGGHVPL